MENTISTYCLMQLHLLAYKVNNVFVPLYVPPHLPFKLYAKIVCRLFICLLYTSTHLWSIRSISYIGSKVDDRKSQLI